MFKHRFLTSTCYSYFWYSWICNACSSEEAFRSQTTDPTHVCPSQFQVFLSLHLTIAQTLCPATGGVCFPSHEHEFVPPRTVEGLADARHRTVLADYVQVVGQIFKTSNDLTKGGFIGNRFRLRNPDASSLKNPCQHESVVYDPWRDWLTNARWVETFQHVCIAVLRSYWWSCFRVLYW